MKALLLVLCLMSLGVEASTSFEKFHEGNQAYDRGDYDTAATRYRELIDQGYDSSDLHFNLGNSYFRGGKLGQAVYHLRQAANRAPRDADVRFNLQYAKEKVADQVESKGSVFAKLGELSRSLNEREAYQALLLMVLLSLGASAIFLFRPAWEWANWLRYVTAGGAAIFFSIAGHHTFFTDRFGAVVAPEIKVYSGIGKDNVVLFALHEGVEFTVADVVDGQWVRIRLADGKQGWVRVESVIF